MSLLFNTLSSFVIAFLPRSRCLLISWLQSTTTVILEPKKRKSVTLSTFSPSICHEVMGPETVTDFTFLGSKITADGDCSHEIKRHLLLGRKVMTNLDSILKSRDIALPTKGPSSQGYGFSSSHVWMWELDYKESWALKNWCFWTVVLEKTLESPLDSKEIQPVSPKGDQSWIFTGGTDAEAETPILWPPDVKNWLIRKDPDAGKDWRWEEKGMTEDEMVGWYHQLNGHELLWELVMDREA